MSDRAKKIIFIVLGILTLTLLIVSILALRKDTSITLDGTDGSHISIPDISKKADPNASVQYEDQIIIFDNQAVAQLSLFTLSNQLGLRIYGRTQSEIDKNLQQAETMTKQFLKIDDTKLCALPITIADSAASVYVFPSCRDGNE